MSLPVSEAARPADASLSLQFDDADADLLARAFRTPGDGPRAWALNGEAHRISLIDGFDRLLAWPSLRGPPIRRRLGTSAALDRVDRHREARPPSRVGATDVVGPRDRGRGPSPQESAQRELAVRRRPLEEVHAAPDRHPDSE